MSKTEKMMNTRGSVEVLLWFRINWHIEIALITSTQQFTVLWVMQSTNFTATCYVSLSHSLHAHNFLYAKVTNLKHSNYIIVYSVFGMPGSI